MSLLVFCRYGQNGDRDRLALQLINARDGSLRWADVYERELGEHQTALPSQVVNDVLAAAGIRSTEIRRPGTGSERMQDRLALNLYKEGQFFMNKYTSEALQRSIVLFRQALERDSTLVDAYVGLGNAYFNLGLAHGDLDPREALALVRESAQRALAIDSASAGGHALLGIYQLGYGWDWDVAEGELERAVELDPAYGFAHENLAFVYATLSKFNEAIREGTTATELDPLTPTTWGDAGVQYYSAGRYQEGVPFVERGLELDPNSHPDRWILGALYIEMREFSRGVAELERALKLSGGQDLFRGYVGYARALMGDKAAAHAVLRRLDTSWRSRSNGNTALAIALVHIGLDNRDQAFGWLDKAYRNRSANLVFVATTPPGRRLASDPRYSALLRRLNLRG